jgi:hypothetical protein
MYYTLMFLLIYFNCAKNNRGKFHKKKITVQILNAKENKEYIFYI